MAKGKRKTGQAEGYQGGCFEMQLIDNSYAYDEENFVIWLKKHQLSQKTIQSKKSCCRTFFSRTELSPETYREYIEEMVEDEKKPTTINNMINSVNSYVRFLGDSGHPECLEWAQMCRKVLKQQYLDDVLSMPDYEFLLKKAEALKEWRVYLYARIAGTTGMRMCEMLQIKREHIEHGCVDIYGKGAKRRRIYFPTAMREKVLSILDTLGLKSGYVFSPNHHGGKPVAENAIQRQLREFGENDCEFPKGLVHAHGFRHFFAKEFIRKYQNLALLADLLGHSNIEVTRIYLKYTSREQADIVNEVVTW